MRRDMKITGFTTEDIRFPTSTGARRLRRHEPRSGLLGGLRGSRDRFAAVSRATASRSPSEGETTSWSPPSRLWRRKSSAGAFPPSPANWGLFWRELTSDSQLRWLGPEKGVVHLATAAVVNALWDLQAKSRGETALETPGARCPRKRSYAPWTSDTSPTPSPRRRRSRFSRSWSRRRSGGSRSCSRRGYPAYTTSVGWLGYPDEKIRTLCREAIAQGFSAFKMKVGRSVEDDVRRAALIREEIGWDRSSDDGREPGVGRRPGDRAHGPSRTLPAAVDRRAYEPRRYSRAREDRPRGRPHRRRHRRALPQPGDVQAAPAGARPSATVRSTAAVSAE